MPQKNAKEKRLARERAARTGESYTAALRAIRTELLVSAADDERAEDDRVRAAEYADDPSEPLAI